VDFQAGSNNPYGTTQTANLGDDANTGIGARRCIVTLDRTAIIAGADPALIHFDFLNITSGAPDDTWTTGDFTTLEGFLDTMFASIMGSVSSGIKVSQYSWYKIGRGRSYGWPTSDHSNPSVRQVAKSISGSATGQEIAPQVACSITFRTAVRRSWGRTYLPLGKNPTGTAVTNGQLTSGTVDGIANAVNTMVGAAAGADFYLVVLSPRKDALLNVERIEVDSNLDVIRSRRWRSSTYKKLLP